LQLTTLSPAVLCLHWRRKSENWTIFFDLCPTFVRPVFSWRQRDFPFPGEPGSLLPPWRFASLAQRTCWPSTGAFSFVILIHPSNVPFFLFLQVFASLVRGEPPRVVGFFRILSFGFHRDSARVFVSLWSFSVCVVAGFFFRGLSVRHSSFSSRCNTSFTSLPAMGFHPLTHQK